MKDLTHDKNGKLCAAKTAYMITLAACLIKVIFSGFTWGEFTVNEADLSGLSLLLGSVGAVYFGRSHTKAKEVSNV